MSNKTHVPQATDDLLLDITRDLRDLQADALSVTTYEQQMALVNDIGRIIERIEDHRRGRAFQVAPDAPQQMPLPEKRRRRRLWGRS